MILTNLNKFFSGPSERAGSIWGCSIAEVGVKPARSLEWENNGKTHATHRQRIVFGFLKKVSFSSGSRSSFKKERVKEELQWKGACAHRTIGAYCWWLSWHLPFGWEGSKKNFFALRNITFRGRLRERLQLSLVVPGFYSVTLPYRVKTWKRTEKEQYANKEKVDLFCLIAHSHNNGTQCGQK